MKLLLLAILASMLLQLAIAEQLHQILRMAREKQEAKDMKRYDSNITLNCDHATGENVWCSFIEYSGKNLGEEESMTKFIRVNCTKNEKITFSPQLQINLKKVSPNIWVYHNCSTTHTTIHFETKLPIFSAENSTNVELNGKHFEYNVTDRGEEPDIFHRLWFYKESKILKYRFVQNWPL